jgi:hypothetical protein
MVYAPDRVESIAPVSADERGSGRRIRSLAQQEFDAYLANQVNAIAPAKIDRVDATVNY